MFASNVYKGVAVILSTMIAAVSVAGQSSGDLEATLQKLGRYVSAYGEQASILVAEEKYTQRVTTAGSETARPHNLVAEFAIVKTAAGWTGFRDVVEVNGKKVTERRDRLLTLFTESTGTESELTRIANESARYNIGPVATNLNLPTTALLFFQPENLVRFTFTRTGAKKIAGTPTTEISFTETQSPTLVRTRDGRDAPLTGKLWVNSEDGTVLRTQMRLRGFGDTMSTSVMGAPTQRPPVNPNVATGGREALARSNSVDPFGYREIKSVADIDVTYARDEATGLWLPSEMLEVYEGPIRIGARPPFDAVSNKRAKYSNFKRFGTGARITFPKEQ